nr:polyprotein [Aconitum potyvirus 2]
MTTFTIGSFLFQSQANGKFGAKPMEADYVTAYDNAVSKAFRAMDQLAPLRKGAFVGGKVVKVKGSRFYTIMKPEQIIQATEETHGASESARLVAASLELTSSTPKAMIRQRDYGHFAPRPLNIDDKPNLGDAKKSKTLSARVHYDWLNLVRAVANIQKRTGVVIELISNRRKVTANRLLKDNKRYVRVVTKHELGYRHKCDVRTGQWDRIVLKQLVEKSSGRLKHRADEFTPGSSGIALLSDKIDGQVSTSRGGVFIIRGRDGSKLYDSQCVVTTHVAARMHHYSVSERFWKGYDRGFQMARGPTDHTCDSNLDVEECGLVAAIATQALFPCGKITCQQCVDKFTSSGKSELREEHSARLEELIGRIQKNHPKFKHVIQFLSFFNDFLNFENNNVDQFSEVNRMIGERQETPFKQLADLNNLMIKIGSCTSEEVALGTAKILEIVRFQRNRTDNIAKGSLAHFRNKVSSKVHVNLDLMCDNQLDDDGNFRWRQRAYHAKRLFSNFFDVIDPANGYDQFIKRKNPNGMRKTAIGNLIVSTNMQTFRQQMRGEPMESVPLSNACTSRLKGGFVYPCCCVTTDEGTPIESDMMIPTKDHLVIGNTGDSKFVNMPRMVEGMYIAKQGYCYVNIFLAMLINVSDAQSKDYTKKVRDIVIPKLGEWPTLLDVATMCHFLTVFYPDVKSAELPRILVDHRNQIMHVIDSFGSLTTGYHILKANTVGQLVKFSNDELQSEMMHYRVGGTMMSEESSEDAAVTLLARGVYRPTELKRVLEKDPLLLVYGLLSPRVLIAMHKSKTLEMALDQWLHKDTSVANLCQMIDVLAKKVSVSKLFRTQQQIISENAMEIARCVDRCRTTSPSRTFVQLVLTRLVESRNTSKELLSAGFQTLMYEGEEMREKKFSEVLAHSWRDLNWSQRCSAIWHSRKASQHATNSSIEPEQTDSGETWTERFICLRGKLTSHVKVWTTSALSNGKRKAYETCGKVVCKLITSTKFFCPDIIKMVNVLSVFCLLLQISTVVNRHLLQYRILKEEQQNMRDDKDFETMMGIYNLYVKTYEGEYPTLKQFSTYLQKVNPQIYAYYERTMGEPDDTDECVELQAKGKGEIELERTIAFVALIMMMFDAERSDCVYKVLNKLRGIMNPISAETVAFQGLDDMKELLGETKMAIDIELDTENHQLNRLGGVTFGDWWTHQLNQNRTVPHYRTEGKFVEFTRANAMIVANEIAHSDQTDFLVMGAVGSGKSTGLPFHLSRKGKVLMIEPTKPLAENVHKQLKGNPFMSNATLRMRGCSVFGSSPITVMTSGYALHYFAHNIAQLAEYQFVIIDECHVHDASAMAFRCLLLEYDYQGKVLKVSATPPGREATFNTQHPVLVKMEESLSFQQFVALQGSGANGDITQNGDNILIYVASYNEVDTLSKMLLDKNHKVTKVDGRTMKMGQVEIPTAGTKEKKHFIVATNIIENGVTLDIDVVVDFGMKVVPELDIDNRLIRYSKVAISYGERIQRLGRVGRNKEGVALRIGVTEKGLSAVPNVTATEAAFYCFAYGLPVMTSGVAVSMLSNCTVNQARTMMHFELPLFYMVHMVRFDGSMHPELHKCLKDYKLRDSEIILNKMAIPSSGVKSWMTAGEYSRLGARNSIEEFVRIPFYARDIPDKVHERVWEVVVTFKRDAGFGKIQSASACKVAYTLQTDAASIPRTICIIEELIKNEVKKQEYFQVASGVDCGSGFSLINITNALRSRHMSNHTAENIAILEAAKNQIYEFRNLGIDPSSKTVCDFGALECVQFQSAEGVSKQLKLKGHWNKSLITKDLLVAGFTLFGGLWMLYNHFKRAATTLVEFQASGKRQSQKRRFQIARNHKHAYEVNPDQTDVEHYFGEAYAKKPQQKGRTKGMGAKSRRFYNIYGFDPAEYTFARYVDPLTGYTLDENALTDARLVQEHFGKIRLELREQDKLDAQALMANQKIEAYFVKDLAKQILKIDMTPHRPLELGCKTSTIAGYPEREGELRQAAPHVIVDASVLPKQNEYTSEGAEFESKATYQGLRDYNSISSSICLLENDSDGYTMKIHGIGFGSMIITNQHLFKRNNGSLKIQSHRGEFLVPNTTQLKMYPFEGRDLLLIQMPKDFPPFPQKLKFRLPVSGERVCLIGSNFQEKYISSTVSESSVIAQKDNTSFFRHWITTQKGHCGLPLVSVKDGHILGIHSMTSLEDSSSFFISLPPDIGPKYLQNEENIEWTKKWRLNLELINWGAFKLSNEKPDNLFKLSKDIFELLDEPVDFQAKEGGWLYDRLGGNITAMARTSNQLVTKHVVKGQCLLFQTYLETHPEASNFFKPLMGFYQKSRLNKEAYIKDLFKYNAPTTVGVLNPHVFELAEESVYNMFVGIGFQKCVYVTDQEAIFSALNMKAATGALYQGKKKEYFENFTEADKAQILKDSCFRLYTGKLGVWNGSLKAELRPLEKVQANKTRSFTAAPIDTLLGGKVCVDDFNNQFYSLNLKAPWSVGMTKFYGGWNTLIRSLPEGWIYCDADGSQFDSSLTPYLINAVLNLRLRFMEDWDVGTQMLENLYTEIVYTPIATPDGTIVKKYKGNNSGQPSTVVDNTIMVILAMHYASGLYNSDVAITEYCVFFVNGDDLIIAVHPDHQAFLDGLKESFTHLGLKYDFSNRCQSREDLWFMSHKAILSGDIYIPKLEEERIVSILEWDRAILPEHRLEAICASMIEAWGYPDLLYQIRRFYYWVLEQAPYNHLSQTGKAPYISEAALKNLYTNQSSPSELQRYVDSLEWNNLTGEEAVEFQGTEDESLNAGDQTKKTSEAKGKDNKEKALETRPKDKDVDVGTSGIYQVPKLKAIGTKFCLPKVKGRTIVNLDHLISYEPEQINLSNARATQSQFAQWYNGVKDAYELDDNSMGIVMSGLMVWCIENGTSPNINGQWTMMDGDEQVEYPLKPVVENAQPSLRQIMAHFSALAEAYIEKRNATKPYMPRYGLLRNLRDSSLARYAFDFYEVTSRTPPRAREAHLQMKAAAIRNSSTKMFGLDGNAGDKEEDTERHTANDVSKNMHSLMGVRM